ncbi:hypothetical protein [Piscirickettsia litoralis]|uniref:Uncharacterized protein n=1 Tax=Piscirickettsia litoralis TaxID=1891921 RepID=A0ABX2ZX87_9GAMM|nr:hypothetical protein [Piscirickettsia litoralis]ODN41236.1 hypothetical protein BGC07_17635 [Piscirickettsia litoralis]
MSWSYDVTQLQASSLFQVRYLIGDTSEKEQLLQDEEINFTLDQYKSTEQAAAACCEGIAARFSRQSDQSAGKVSDDLSQKSEQYLKLAEKIRSRASSSLGVGAFYAGGVNKADDVKYRSDSTINQPRFIRGMFNDRQAGY